MPGTEAAAPLAVAVEERGRWVVVRVRGELTFGTCGELTDALAGAAGPGGVAVDVSGLDFFDSSGIRCLVLAARRARAEGAEFVVVDPGPVLRQRAEWMGLGEVLAVVPALPG